MLCWSPTRSLWLLLKDRIPCSIESGVCLDSCAHEHSVWLRLEEGDLRHMKRSAQELVRSFGWERVDL